MRRQHTLFFIYLSFIAAIFLAFLPLPLWASWLKPSWIMLVLIYWLLVLPCRVGVGAAWIIGLIIDVISSQPLGGNAAATVVIGYFLIRFQEAMRSFSLLSKLGVVFILLVAYQLWLCLILEGRLYMYSVTISLVQALVNILLWPWVALLLSAYQRRFKLETNYT